MPTPAFDLERRTFLRAAAAAAGVATVGGRLASASPAQAAGGNLQALQQAFVNWRFGMFMHFNMSTFHDVEWCAPNQDPRSFNPTRLDCDQWAAAARSAGMTFGVLTTKHHDGFALWPTKQTGYNVMSSSVRVDVVKLFVDAFRRAGLTACLYFSIWDRTQGVAKGSVSRADVDYTKNQLTELLGGTYGRIPLLVIDGWAWQMGHREMPYGELREHVKSLQPDCLIVDHNGQTEPWEEDAIYFEEPKGLWCPQGNTFASVQGQNVTSNGWFWHPPGSAKGSTAAATPRSAANIVNDHLKLLEPRYCNFLLNCPPNDQGLLDRNITDRLAEVGRLWRPSAARAALPAQPDVLLHPVTPVAVTATSGVAANAADGWIDDAHGAAVQTLWQSTGSLPQSVTLDLGAAYAGIDALSYLPRQDHDQAGTRSTTGNITRYRILTSTDGRSFGQVATGTWGATKALKWARWTAVRARYVRLEALAAAGASYAVVNEVDCGGIATRPTTGTGVPATGYVRIVNRRSGLDLDVSGGSGANGAAIVQGAPSSHAQWSLVDAGGGYRTLVNRQSRLALDVEKGSTAIGAHLIQYRRTGGTNQQWQLVDAGGGYVRLVSRVSGLVADVRGGSTVAGADVLQYTWSGSTNQQWRIVML